MTLTFSWFPELLSILFCVGVLLLALLVLGGLVYFIYSITIAPEPVCSNDIEKIIQLRISKEMFKTNEREKVFTDSIIYYYKMGKIKNVRQLERYIQQELDQTEWIDFKRDDRI